MKCLMTPGSISLNKSCYFRVPVKKRLKGERAEDKTIAVTITVLTDIKSVSRPC